MREVFIVSVARTPIGSFNGSLAAVSAVQLGATAIKGALNKINLDPNAVQEVYMGNVLTANEGQAPARQAALAAGLSNETPCTTLNKVCASGMKAIMIAAQSIQTGMNDVVIAGGMESMSNVPYYLEASRWGQRLGHGKTVDGILQDGLMDPYKNYHMGNAAEVCARDMNISREDQDAYAIESYTRSAKASAAGFFNDEIVPVVIPQRKGDPIIVDTDEEFTKVNFDKLKSLNPVFEKTGTVTAANASTINDGAAAIVLMSADAVAKYGVTPLAKIVGMADAAQEPEWFTTAPAKALPIAIKRAGLSTDQIDFFEINEAFSVVCIANNQLLGIDAAKANVYGGAVSLGHPIGCSGARIVVTLSSVLRQNKGKFGAAGICNGGGGASALVIENLA